MGTSCMPGFGRRWRTALGHVVPHGVVRRAAHELGEAGKGAAVREASRTRGRREGHREVEAAPILNVVRARVDAAAGPTKRLVEQHRVVVLDRICDPDLQVVPAELPVVVLQASQILEAAALRARIRRDEATGPGRRRRTSARTAQSVGGRQHTTLSCGVVFGGFALPNGDQLRQRLAASNVCTAGLEPRKECRPAAAVKEGKALSEGESREVVGYVRKVRLRGHEVMQRVRRVHHDFLHSLSKEHKGGGSRDPMVRAA